MRRWKRSIPSAASTRRQCAGRPADHRARRHPRRARRRSPTPRSISPRLPPSSPIRPNAPIRTWSKSSGAPSRPGRFRALTFTRANAERPRPALSPHRALRLPPRGAGALRQAAAVGQRAAREARAVARARRRHAHRRRGGRKRAARRRYAGRTGEGAPIARRLTLGATGSANGIGRERPGSAYGQEKDHLPGRAGGEFASRLPRSLSGPRAGALPDLRGLLLGADRRRRRPRHDPDREFGRRPRRRHPSSDADGEAAHHRRMVPADPQSIDGAEGRDA